MEAEEMSLNCHEESILKAVVGGGITTLSLGLAASGRELEENGESGKKEKENGDD